MRKLLVPFAGFMFCVLCAFVASPDLKGKWTVFPVNDDSYNVEFKDDGTYVVSTTQSTETINGKYMQTDDTLAIMDEGCGDVWGKYQITFFGNDSLQLKGIDDACSDRMHNVDGLAAKRQP